ncbi:biotin-dependent carboxyltransferase family protein [Amycolatopsis sp. CA-230715]|uniref:5-oxoprolinase subunit C family protein n=1 Tax=Amycolatopsis sp. CA-230715 TaxID=2745196 RepID=UPI0020B209AA|nr:biotin-dependent carboxyltransferase family protein [Amycolatopsis sp. CA-230715]
MKKLEVVRPGPFATVQDLGRPGLAAIGVGRSGAADRRSFRLANRLVGNPEGCAAIEATLGGLVVRFTEHAVVAVTGAPCAITAGARAAGMSAPIPVRPGDEVSLATPDNGLRSYLAVRGGIDVPPVLGSRATDTMARLGPAALTPGCVLPVGTPSLPHPPVDLAPQRPFPDELVLRVVPGPRLDWFAEDALTSLLSAPHRVTAEADRVGIRLDGPVLRRARGDELPPEAGVLGALQVPPSGHPILFLADHPVTGGYPVPAVVLEDDVDLAAQARPGQSIRFSAP